MAEGPDSLELLRPILGLSVHEIDGGKKEIHFRYDKNKPGDYYVINVEKSAEEMGVLEIDILNNTRMMAIAVLNYLHSEEELISKWRDNKTYPNTDGEIWAMKRLEEITGSAKTVNRAFSGEEIGSRKVGEYTINVFQSTRDENEVIMEKNNSVGETVRVYFGATKDNWEDSIDKI